MSAVTAQQPLPRAQRAFFIDSENGMSQLIKGVELLDRSDKVIVFYRDNIANSVRAKVEMSAPMTEWIACVDPGIKNSMDVQIIAELSARLQADEFDFGFVVSNDKGYLPAIHYLEQTKRAHGHVLELVPTIEHAVVRGALELVQVIRTLHDCTDLERAFALAVGRKNAGDVLEQLSNLLSQRKDGATNAIALMPEASEPSSELDDWHPTDNQGDEDSFKNTVGIGKAISAKLGSVGINGPKQLADIGAPEAWKRIRKIDRAFPAKWMCVFEAAILGISPDSLCQERKKELKRMAKEFTA